MNTPKISLHTWLAQNYAVGEAPHINTARRWCHDGLIYPLPEKQGREYYLMPEARYVGRNGPTLLERMNNGQAARHS